MFTLVNSYGQDGIIGNINNQDTIKYKIDSITTFILTPDSKLAYASDEMPTAPNGLFAIYRADTIKGELRMAIYYTYEGDIMSLRNYYYLNNKLIKVTEYRSNLKRKKDKKADNYERTCYYWNDILYYAYNPTNEPFYSKFDSNNAERVLKRFQQKYALNQLDFNHPKK